MRKTAPPLLAILRTQLQGELLARVYLRKNDSGTSISDLARELGHPVPTVHREVTRLVEAGLLEQSTVGRTRIIVKPAGNDRVTRPLTELLAATYGPLAVLRELFGGLPGVEAAYIFGSWAARYQGEPGPVPNDVDVLVVGEVTTALLDEIADEAERTLAREVNIRRVRAPRWRDPEGDVFLSTIKERPLVSLTTNVEEPHR